MVADADTPHPVEPDVAGRVAAAVADHVGASVVSVQPLSGGDVAMAYRVDLATGRTLFAKTHRNPPPGFFVTEARGLAELAASGVVRVPDVVAVADHPMPLLVLSWVDEVPGERPDEVAFGAQLAAMHATGASCFGRSDARPTGSRQLPNTPCASWPEFYAACRLVPLAQLAADSGALDPATIAAIERLADRLDAFGAAGESPALVHGDLWAGNRLVDRSGASWLIDPACHGGHREFDLAMMALFGGFGPDAFAAYDNAFPLVDGWRERQPLHQLAPLVVHAIKFGGGYRQATMEAVAALESRSH